MKERKPFGEWDPALAKGFVASFEGLRLSCYYCPGHVKTIGYGHVATGYPDGFTITPEEAEEILLDDLRKHAADAAKVVTVPVSEGEFKAILSFVFNLGGRNFRDSTLLRKLNAGDYLGAANEFPRWVYAGGKKLSGLVNRRDLERWNFLHK